MRIQTSIVLVLLASLAGCGNTGTVSGTVTMNGELLKHGGAVSFHPVGKGPTAIGRIDPEGRYSLLVGDDSRLPAGEYKVTIIGYAPTAPVAKPSDTPPAPPVITLLKYRSPETTPITRTVVAGSNKFDFDVEPAEK